MSEKTIETENTKLSFQENRATGRKAETLVQNTLEMSGYDVIRYGIEDRTVNARKLLVGKHTATNNRIRSMPDFLVVNKENKEAILLEVKYQSNHDFKETMSNFIFGYKQLEDYIEYWKESVIVFLFPSEPFCKCVRLSDIDPATHIQIPMRKEDGKWISLSRFNGIYKDLNEIFPKINDELMQKIKSDVLLIKNQ